MKKISFLIILILISCNRVPRNVGIILKAAGENRIELEKVIVHYKSSGDKEKLNAAYFLIGNMGNKCTLNGEGIRKYDAIFEIFDSLNRNNSQITAFSPYLEKKWDSLVAIYGEPTMKGVEIFPDYRYIKAEFLIENIDIFFKLKEESPWLRNISFGDFCEFVLPYRSGKEPLES